MNRIVAVWLVALGLSNGCVAGERSLAWDPPTTMTNGAAIPAGTELRYAVMVNGVTNQIVSTNAATIRSGAGNTIATVRAMAPEIVTGYEGSQTNWYVSEDSLPVTIKEVPVSPPRGVRVKR